jgi:polyisoprenoid-binding protein YceI
MAAQALQELLNDGKLAGSWTLDPAESRVVLSSKSMWNMVKVNGVFRDVAGEGTVTADGQVTGTITVAATSVDTKNAKRDTHLRSADFFDADNHASIVFTVGGVAPATAGQGVTVAGTLTVRDQTKPVTFDAAVSSASGDEVVIDADVQVNRSDYGLTWNQLGMASMHHTITIHAAFTRK